MLEKNKVDYDQISSMVAQQNMRKKDDTDEAEILNVLRAIMAKMLIIDEAIIMNMDDGILLYLFTQIVSKLTSEIAGDVENFQK